MDFYKWTGLLDSDAKTEEFYRVLGLLESGEISGDKANSMMDSFFSNGEIVEVGKEERPIITISNQDYPTVSVESNTGGEFSEEAIVYEDSFGNLHEITRGMPDDMEGVEQRQTFDTPEEAIDYFNEIGAGEEYFGIAEVPEGFTVLYLGQENEKTF